MLTLMFWDYRLFLLSFTVHSQSVSESRDFSTVICRGLLVHILLYTQKCATRISMLSAVVDSDVLLLAQVPPGSCIEALRSAMLHTAHRSQVLHHFAFEATRLYVYQGLNEYINAYFSLLACDTVQSCMYPSWNIQAFSSQNIAAYFLSMF